MTKSAIEPQTPIRRAFLPYGGQLIEEDDVQAVVQVLRSRWLTTGPAVPELEAAFARRVGAAFGVAVSSGTAALHVACAAAGIGPGDEVIVPAITFVASANCVVFQGATPVFADVERDTLLLDPASAEAHLTQRTKAIIAVDYAGQPCDYDALRAIAARHRLTLIADACHALGAQFRGRPVGSLADLNTFSFHPVKPITAGEGGLVTTSDGRFAERMRLVRNHGIAADFRQREAAATWRYEMTELGYNYRLTDLQCALALSQLKKLDRWVARRRAIAARYTGAFARLPELETPTVRPDRDCAWHLYVIRLRLERLRAGRAEIFAALRAENIGVNVHYIPVPWQPFYQERGYGKGRWPVAEQEYERLISLPVFPAMNGQDIQDVIDAVEAVISRFRR
jgi:perosamine synthetase